MLIREHPESANDAWNNLMLVGNYNKRNYSASPSMSESFIVICLNHHALELSDYEYITDNGP